MSDTSCPHCGAEKSCRSVCEIIEPTSPLYQAMPFRCGSKNRDQSELCREREAHNQTKRERNSARAKFVAAIDGRDMANEEADKLREQNAKLLEETITYWKERERIALNAASEHSESVSKLHRRAQRVEAQNAKLREIAEKAITAVVLWAGSRTNSASKLRAELDQLK